jgi:hypothetical protein
VKRKYPRKETTPGPDVKMEKIRLWRGPMHRVEVMIPDGEKTYVVGPSPRPMWIYEDSGARAVGGLRLFVKRPRSWHKRMALRWYIGMFGKDPRLQPEQEPRRVRKQA